MAEVQTVPFHRPVVDATPPWFSFFVGFDGAATEPDRLLSGHIVNLEVLGCHGGRTGVEQILSAAGVDVPEQYDLPPETGGPDVGCADSGINAGVCFCALFPAACFAPSGPLSSCVQIEADLTCSTETGVYELPATVSDISGSGLDLVKIEDSGTTIIAGPTSVNVPGGDSENDPWQLATGAGMAGGLICAAWARWSLSFPKGMCAKSSK